MLQCGIMKTMERVNPRDDLKRFLDVAERALSAASAFPSDFEEFNELQKMCDEVRETYFPETLDQDGDE